jgi:hypothetical protein
VKICAVADQHGRLPTIPDCDVLFTTPFNPDIMRQRQAEWLDTYYRAWELTVPAKHILATPGNHDWFTRLPDGLRTRLFIDEGCEIDGKTFWFTPWSEAPPSVYHWNYILGRGDRARQWQSMPRNLNVLVSHAPAHKVCDIALGGNRHCGCPEMRALIQSRTPEVFCHGHIHEAQRYGGPKHHLGRTTTYCCSMWGAEWKPVEFELR